MKVLQINAVSGIRSTGRICTEITEYLNKNGHQGYLAYSDGIHYKKGYKIGNKFDVKIHGLLSRIFGLQAYFSKGETSRLVNYISNLKPDVVHLHNLHSNYINLKILLNYLAKNDIPTVITLHDCWFYTGKCTHYTVDNCFKWQVECGVCPRLKKDNPSWFFDRTSKMLQDKEEWFSHIPRLAVVGVSDWITNEARKSFLSSAKILTRIYNWIDIEVFKPVDGTLVREKLNIEDKFVILGVASGWSKAKGLDKFVELADAIRNDMVIVLVGGLKSDTELPANIIHIHETHNTKELAAFYSMADVYIHLSKEETYGKTIAESLSCGTPAIVINSTACPEIVDKSCGIIVENNNLHTLIEAINIIEEKGKNFYSQNAVLRVELEFKPQKNLLELNHIYKKLLYVG